MASIPIFGSKHDLPSSFWRPPLHFNYLPLRTRWEATRRHSVYIVSWKAQNASELSNKDGECVSQEIVDASRFLLLGAIGVNAEAACNPATEFSELGELNPAWRSGVVQPMSLGKMATLLLTYLPKETLSYLGMKFVEAGLEDEVDSDGNPTISQKLKSIREVAMSDHSTLDSMCPEPFLSIAPGASGRQAGKETRELLKSWKENFDLEEVSNRNQKHKDYFEVWDLREGWEAGQYKSGHTKTFAEVANATDRPLSTVHSQFKKAFQLITGHSYSIDAYLDVFGWFRYFSFAPGNNGMRNRRIVESTRRPVTETKLNSPVASSTETSDNKPSVFRVCLDLISEFEELRQGGRSEKEAADWLGFQNLDAYYSLVDVMTCQQAG